MIDRRKVAGVLLVVGAVLAVASSFMPVFSTLYRGYGSDLAVTTTLWITTSEPIAVGAEQSAFFAAGWPVVLSAVVMAVAVVLMQRERTAFVGRPLAVGGAGALAGVVFFYVVQVLGLEEIVISGDSSVVMKNELHYHGGMYVLVVGAIIGLVGAGVAQQRYVAPAEVVDEDGVVVRQLGGDDDTPPFGIAIPGDDEQRETR